MKRRRPPKKIPIQPKEHDEELAVLASVLDEHRLDNNAEGWFKVPWRNGWNAVGLATTTWDSIEDGQSSDNEYATFRFLSDVISSRQLQGSYEVANLLLDRAHHKLLYAGLRCLQVLASNSHGGGEVYNTILRLAFDAEQPSLLFEHHVLHWRCLDALGVEPTLNGDKFDRQRRAFFIAWKRGLYHSAYSIKPCK